MRANIDDPTGMIELPIVQIDAFTARRFAGNPAAVLLFTAETERLFADSTLLASIAREMNLSETAFLRRTGAASFDLRWFTPGAEVKLCGHATLASTHHLFESGAVASGLEIEFSTLSGILKAKKHEEREGAWITLDFPADPPEQAAPPPTLLSSLGLPAESVVWVGKGKTDYLIELSDPSLVRALKPDFAALKSVEARGIIVTARADEKAPEGSEILSRFFCPSLGVDEDPVTGSAHCLLTPYWSKRLDRPGAELLAYQASSRGGALKVREAAGRVFISGQAVTVLRGSLILDRG